MSSLARALQLRDDLEKFAREQTSSSHSFVLLIFGVCDKLYKFDGGTLKREENAFHAFVATMCRSRVAWKESFRCGLFRPIYCTVETTEGSVPEEKLTFS